MNTIDQLVKCLKKAVLQNGCDMILTGEDLRECEKAIALGEQELKRDACLCVCGTDVKERKK